MNLEFAASEIPTESRLMQELAERSATHTEKWWLAVKVLRTIVTIDYLAVDQEPKESSLAIVPGWVFYRPPRLAMLKTWTILEPEGRDPSLRAELLRQDRILVTVPGTERTVLVVTGDGAGKVEVGLDPSGAIISLAVAASGSKADRAVALAAIPTALGGAVSMGSAIGQSLDPRALELARLKGELEVADARAKLKGPADPDPQLKNLRDRLTAAELEARIATAELISANPSKVKIVVHAME